jgi:hypothetical protein
MRLPPVALNQAAYLKTMGPPSGEGPLKLGPTIIE